MNKKNLMECLLNILKSILPYDEAEITATNNLRADLLMDAYDITEVVYAVECALCIKIRDDQAWPLVSGSFANFVDEVCKIKGCTDE